MILFKPKKSSLKNKPKRSKDKKKERKKDKKHFRSLSIEQMNGATYSWPIRAKHSLIEDILNAKNKQKFTSDKFKVGEIEFCLELYPNGFDENSVGLTDLFLKLLTMPSEWTEVWINYRLFCNETLSSWTFIQKFKKSGFWGWHDGCLLFHDLKKEILSNNSNKVSGDDEDYEQEEQYEEESYSTDPDEYSNTVKKHSSTDLLSPYGDDYVAIKFGDIAISFSSFIQILRVHSKSGYKRNKKIVYEKNLLYSNEYHFKLGWDIDSDLLNRFTKCENGKYFESEIFYEMWNLRISPNGCNYNSNNGEQDSVNKNNDGNLTLFLNLCCLPPKISKIKVKYVLYEENTGIKWKFSREFSYTASLSGWPDGKLLTDDLKNYNTLRFMANIYIVKMYDMKGKQIDIHHADNLTEIKEDEQIGSEKQISTEYTKSPSPNPPSTMIVATQSELSNTPELTKQNSNNSKNNGNISNNNNILNTNIITNNTPISPIIGPQQQQTHTHNITINNSNKEYKELGNKINTICNKIDTISSVVLLMQKQINVLNDNVEYIKQKQIKDDEYKQNIIYILNEMRNEITNLYTYNTHTNTKNHKTNTHKRKDRTHNHNNTINYHRSTSPMNNELEYEINNNYLQIDDRLLINPSQRRPRSVRVDGDKSLKHKHNNILTPLTPYNSGMTHNTIENNQNNININYNDKINRKYKTKRKQTSNNKLKSRKKREKKENIELTNRQYLRQWLTNNVGLAEYYDIFVENGVEDLRMVMDLTINELRLLGIHHKQHQLQIQKEITKLRNSIHINTNSISSNLFDTV